ncbi:flagellar hook assembly protein FlgD [Gilvimarinus agarilyticus]|uniref:flagellar hook assembly protein FlgD n=1 Tax=unclassified Gilvimarinus TaxID=2642066 RepID=UPI001C0952C6|nr:MULTISPECIES: flagellar hook assembly protein FlgD [unclassified Gilvimarinus]MBU2887258.1 flagellar hook assembly protein FlgD [Gilvimarinus agarilyticus]MDO6571917.1 flagellar hook assembly protein FlgD [Gilvimarinus sp. 2_MG-2023]MDO6745986.1 flagellar hook assembly protein FlgD [Gilvimarinus sp. 1_MG-2023]
MTQVSNDGTSAANILSNLSIANKEPEEASNELGQSAFLELMITQMNNQDPLSPQENTEFIAQLAQFSSVEGLERLNGQFESFNGNFMSNQALQASSLVGRSVSVPTDTALLTNGGIVAGSLNLEQSTSAMEINIYSEGGSLVGKVPVDGREAGDMVFRWDGQYMEVDGELVDWSAGEEPLPPGEYRIEVNAMIDGEAEQLETSLGANVNSVTLGNDGSITLNLAGVGPVDISQVTQFN